MRGDGGLLKHVLPFPAFAPATSSYDEQATPDPHLFSPPFNPPLPPKVDPGGPPQTLRKVVQPPCISYYKRMIYFVGS